MITLANRHSFKVARDRQFGAKEAVAGIDLEVAAGSLAGLVGPNGVGKTTSRTAFDTASDST
jgi:ABC-type branched-subunit amino acid transport system ATPase component